MRELVWVLVVCHPALFGAYFVLALYGHNLEKVPTAHTYLPLAIVVGSCLLLSVLLGVILRDWVRTSLATSLVVVMFFTYGHLPGTATGTNWAVLIGWSVLLLLGLIFLVWHRPRALLVFSLVTAAVLVLIPTVTIASYEFTSRQYPEFEARTGKCNTVPPDIYYIVVDKYAGFETLRENFDYENSAFTDFLTYRGFYVACESYTNYPLTGPSIASSLCMDYVFPSYPHQTTHLTQNHAVWRYLEPMGYKYVQVGSRNCFTENNEYADANYVREDGPLATEFASMLYENTVLYALIGTPIEELDSRRVCWKDVQYQFDVLSEIPGMKEPTFTFAHILCPHHPFVFERDGSFKTVGTYIGDEDWNERYLDQLICLNGMLEQLVNRILDSSETSVIVIQSDEGTRTERLLEIQEAGGFAGWPNNPTEEALSVVWERFEILNAYYLPGGSDALYSTITPVNSFRVIFNELLGGDFDLLPDRNYGVLLSSPAVYVDVTDLVRKK